MPNKIKHLLLCTILFFSYAQLSVHAKYIGLKPHFDRYIDFIFHNKSKKYTVLVKKGIQPGMQNNTYVAYKLSPSQKETYYTGTSIFSARSEWFISVLDGDKRLCSTRVVFLFVTSGYLVNNGSTWFPDWHTVASLYLHQVQRKNADFKMCKGISPNPVKEVRIEASHYHHPVSIGIFPPDTA